MSDNQIQSRAHLNSLFRRMTPVVQGSYNKVIEEQLALGIIEKVPGKQPVKRVFYMPHKPLVRERAASTKVRMVFDASSKPSREAYSIIECMNPGPTLQSLLWDIMIRSRMAPVCVVGNVTKAFFQIEVHPEDGFPRCIQTLVPNGKWREFAPSILQTSLWRRKFTVCSWWSIPTTFGNCCW